MGWDVGWEGTDQQRSWVEAEAEAEAETETDKQGRAKLCSTSNVCVYVCVRVRVGEVRITERIDFHRRFDFQYYFPRAVLCCAMLCRDLYTISPVIERPVSRSQ